MRISFADMENPIDVADRGITVLQIENKQLFSRVCESLISMLGERAKEPYTIWDEDGCEIRPDQALMVVPNSFDLPWKRKDLIGNLYAHMERELLFDEELRQEIQGLHVALESSVQRLGFQFNADYKFGVEWNISSYLKAFSYGIDISDTASLLDKLISFIDLGADMEIDKAIVFINLKTFLTKNDLERLHDRLFFHRMRALLLENHDAPFYEDVESKYVVDQDFVEYVFDGKSEFPSSSQGRICSNGFGAVSF